MVDVEQCRLACLEQHDLPPVEGLLEHQGGVRDHRTQTVGVPESSSRTSSTSTARRL